MTRKRRIQLKKSKMDLIYLPFLGFQIPSFFGVLASTLGSSQPFPLRPRGRFGAGQWAVQPVGN